MAMDAKGTHPRPFPAGASTPTVSVGSQAASLPCGTADGSCSCEWVSKQKTLHVPNGRDFSKDQRGTHTHTHTHTRPIGLPGFPALYTLLLTVFL